MGAKGKQITISGGWDNIDIVGLLEEDITLNLSSSFEPFISQVPGGRILNQLSTSLGLGVSTQMTQFGFLTWTKTEPLSFTATVGFYATSHAKTEVYDKAIKLSKTPLPKKGKSAIGRLGNLRPPGPAFTELFTDDKGNITYDKKKSTGRTIDKHKGGSFVITIGKILTLNKAIIVKAEPTFSSDVDKSGYPIWAKVSLDIKSITSAYASLLDNHPK